MYVIVLCIISPFRLRLLPPPHPTADISPLSLTPFPKQIPAFWVFWAFLPEPVPISWTVSSSCIETKDIAIFLAQKFYYYLHYTSLYLPIFIQWYLSTCVSERHNPLVNKKNFPMQYHTCVPYVITNTSTRKSARGSRHDKTFSGKLRKDGKKSRPPSPYLHHPTLIRNSDRCVGIGQCFVGRRSERDSFFLPRKRTWNSVLLGRGINRVAIRACAYKGPCHFFSRFEWVITTNEHQKPFTA